jgi:hypothetical protein
MAEQLLTTTIQAPGFNGVNRQDSSVGLDAGFATRAENCVIDKYGRVGSRKGWTAQHASVGSLGINSVRFIQEFSTIDGTEYTVVGGNNKLYKLAGGVLTELTYGGGGTAPTITDSHWQGASLNGALYLYQDGHDPLIFDPDVSTTAYKRISEASGYLGTVVQSTCAISAFGRVWSGGWSGNKSLIQFSDILNGRILSTGTSGTLDVSSVWPDGEDQIMALGAHNNLLFVFGRRQVLVYANPTDPYTMSMVDTLSGVGCVARDSVVVTGSDIVFLSDSGVRSMQRTIQEKSAPMRELSLNVRDDLINLVGNEDAKAIKAVYSDVDAFYLLSLPVSNTVFCFDMRQFLQNGAARTTTWTNITPTAFHYNNAKQVLMGQRGYVGVYSGYTDNTAAYTMTYYTNFFDFGSPTELKILKKAALTFIGNTASNINIRYGFEYSDIYYSRPTSINSTSIAYYNVDEFGESEFSTGIFVQTSRLNLGGSGTVLQLGIETSINGNALSVQRIDCYVKQGKTR